MKPLLIYLADLTHVGLGIATEAFPLNIGLIASYAKKHLGNAISIHLFKLPETLKSALIEQPPDILGCSNYTWNSNLSYHFIQMVKSLNRGTMTVFGGTNYPFTRPGQEEFLRSHPDLDLHTFYESEIAFASIVNSYMDGRHATPSGCQRLIDGSLSSGNTLERIRFLDGIPSPYTSGLLDEFFSLGLTPLMETSRGCPFTCNFCNAGDSYYTKVNTFSIDYIRDEMEYVARKCRDHSIGHLTLADNNFGMLPRDREVAEIIYKCREKYGWPKSMTAWTGKNAKERVIDVTQLLGSTLSISMSVQSMDPEVLKTIGRDNIKLDHYRSIANSLQSQGRPQHAEVIMPLPGETLTSHLKGLNELLDSNVNRVQSHTLQILYGTPYKDDPAYRKRYSMETYHRVVPLDFSRIDNQAIFDTEEVCVATNTFPFSDYLKAREYALIIDLCHSSQIFVALQKFLAQMRISNSVWISYISAHIRGHSKAIDEVLDSFVQESKDELWDSSDNLKIYYSDPINYQKLIDYEEGGNVLFKHRVWIISRLSLDFIEAVFQITATLFERMSAANYVLLQNVLRYTLAVYGDCLNGRETHGSFTFNIPRLVSEGVVESCYINLFFRLDPNQADVLRDGFMRYGNTLSGLVKLIQRTSIVLKREVTHTSESHPTPNYGPGYSSM